MDPESNVEPEVAVQSAEEFLSFENTHEHCGHIATAPFQMVSPAAPAPILGQLKVCCHCGRAQIAYMGLVETGHGEYALFQSAPKSSGLVVPKPGFDPNEIANRMTRRHPKPS